MRAVLQFSLVAVGITACDDATRPSLQAPPLAVVASGNPFIGSWENTDPLDGSHQHLAVSNGPTLPVRLRDDGGTICIGAGLGFVPVTLEGFGVVTSGDPFRLAVTGDVYCYPGGGRQLVAENVTLPFSYDAARDVLTTDGSDCWYRSGRPGSCSAAPVTSNPFIGSWENTDPLDGSHQHLTVSDGPTMPVRLRDDGGTICIGAGLGFVPATVEGFGVVTGDAPFRLTVTGDVYCHPVGGPQLIVEDIVLPFTYDAARDILTTDGSDCWYRSGKPETCA
ncbi:MAG TPA: hypothetical protein VNI61_10570 [Gemmatimonadales bacterium]|nr:hypothetical protein [Gemmatimonadales bacterium]